MDEKRVQIFGNQLGYLPDDVKKIIIKNITKKEFSVYCEEESVYTGITDGPFLNLIAGEEDSVADVSAIRKPGIYTLKMEGITEVFIFSVDEAVYEELIEKTVRFFYLQRCGCRLPKILAGDFAHESCHGSMARIYGTNQYIRANGGWHDAGDYGRYIVAAAVTVADLLLSYDANPKMFARDFRLPETSTSMPGYLSEIKYELEWMLRMQDMKTGKVYHKVTCENFCGFCMPEDEKEELVVSPESVTATATFSAVMAMAMEYFMPYDETFAKSCIKASIKAYDAMKGMFIPGGFHNPKGIVTGEYGDTQDIDERYWAAAQLYKATGEENYRRDFENYAVRKIYHGYGWEEVGTFGNIAYLTTQKYATDITLKDKIKQEIIAIADDLMMVSEADPYETTLKENEYCWGSNMYVAENGNHLCDAYNLTGDNKYLSKAKEQFHYLLGKNPTGYSYVTGFGQKTPENPHHRPSAAVKKAMEGMLVGGPDSRLQDSAAQEYCSTKAAPNCYVDNLESYSTNEVSIYWNSALIYLMAVIM